MKLIATLGPLTGLVLNLEDKEEWIIGRDPDQCNFILDDTTVSRKHAKIHKTEDGYVIKNLSTTNPIEVNDDRVDEYVLSENDRVKIGDTTFVYTGLDLEDIKEEDQPTEIEKEKKPREESSNETIFEEAEEELPIPIMIEAPFILKVISGANAGSEFGMEIGKSYVIGKDTTSCDLIFSDLSVSKQNSKITIDEKGNIFVEDLKSKNGTYVNNKKIIEKTKITTEDLVTLGTTTFLVIEKEKATETIYSPAPTFETKEETEEKAVKASIWKKQFIPTRHLIFAGSFLLIFFVVFLSFFGLFRSKDVEVVKTMPTDKIENITKEFDSVEFSFNPTSSNLFLVGHVLTSIDKQELLYDLNQLHFIQNIEDNIIVDETIIKNFNDTLSEEESFRSVYVSASKPGNFILEGYVKTPVNFTTLTDFMNLYFPYLDKLNNKVTIEQILQVQIATDLSKHGFGSITFELISGELVLAGKYNKKQESGFKKLLETLSTIEGIRSIKNLAISSSTMESRIDLTSKYKITGWAKYDHKNFSVVANGKIVIPGDILDAMLVTNITQSAILLEKDEIKYKINYSP